MDIKKLVSETLQEIAEGAFDAKTLLPNKLSISPTPDKFDGNISVGGKIICFAEFDIVIGVERQENGDGRIIAFLPTLGFSAKGERKDKITDAARVKFQVPYTLF